MLRHRFGDQARAIKKHSFFEKPAATAGGQLATTVIVLVALNK